MEIWKGGKGGEREGVNLPLGGAGEPGACRVCLTQVAPLVYLSYCSRLISALLTGNKRVSNPVRAFQRA